MPPAFWIVFPLSVILVLIGSSGSSRTVILAMSIVTPLVLIGVIALINLIFSDKPHQFGPLALGIVLVFVPTAGACAIAGFLCSWFTRRPWQK